MVFLDFTAQTCTNCKYNERNIFIKPEVKSLLGQYVLVHLYTDNVPLEYQSSMNGPENEQTAAGQVRNAQLPLYAIVKPKDGRRLRGGRHTYAEGKINNVSGFAKFLQDPLQSPGAQARADAGGERAQPSERRARSVSS